ncbi:exodeoxyribonuclease III [Methylophilaceae bacterium 11]|uniref:exodeoxyribonuclease III n=1 Tax=unclassified Methylotenera TaxID=2643294 RepID=UPI00044D30B2|nr:MULTISPECIES: exodeoxyribonuclease III [unclassified Methylotenera]EUJ09452.1 exodeoxyribonuclease III [Methylophilaceae bacterium 11]
MKLATWNVNSLNVRLPHVLDWLNTNQPDALCLQETKQEDSKFPYEALKEIGYNAIHNGQKTYNGVAILSPHALENVQRDMPNFADEQRRVIAATIQGVRVICAYVVNGQAVDSDKYQYKLRWLQAFHAWLIDELKQHANLAVLGDYNIAPQDRDCHDPAAWLGQVLVSPPEREAFNQLLSLGLHDSFRLLNNEDGQFTWWDYRMAGFRRNLGMRIDHILVSTPLTSACTTCVIDKAPRKLERPSDHTPVVLELNV